MKVQIYESDRQWCNSYSSSSNSSSMNKSNIASDTNVKTLVHVEQNEKTVGNEKSFHKKRMQLQDE